MPELKEIFFCKPINNEDENRINSFWSLSEANWESLSFIYIEWFENDNEQCSDARWTGKCFFEKLEMLRID